MRNEIRITGLSYAAAEKGVRQNGKILLKEEIPLRILVCSDSHGDQSAMERRKYGSHHRSSRLNQLSFGSYNKPFAPNRTQFDWLTRDDAVVDAYGADPYCGFVFTVSAFQDLFGGLSFIQNKRNLAKILPGLPVFLFSGSEDPVGGKGRGVQKVAHALLDAGVRNVTVKLYAGARHGSKAGIRPASVPRGKR